MTALVIAPDPSPPAIAAARQVAGDDALWLAPWAVDQRLAVGPARWRRFVERRRGPVARCAGIAGWPLVDLALAAWTRSVTDRRYRSLMWRRRAVARLAARLVRRGDFDGVVAPSLAALEPFAAAGPAAERVLVEDLPGLRQLHIDLERAAERHPDCAFLRRYRAPDDQIVRQETEAVLADAVIVRGHFAAERHPGKAQVTGRYAPRPAGEPARPDEVVLAGLAAARHGSCELYAALEARPDLRALVRAGEGAEPAALLRHPRVRAVSGPIDVSRARAVIAPSWCESYPIEVAAAAAAGVPIAATRRAAGMIADAALAAVIAPGDIDALVAAL